MVIASLAVTATNYSGTMTVTVNGESSSQSATVNITENSGTYTLSIDNFILGGELPVGKIVLEDLNGSTAYGATNIVTSQNINIEAGSDTSIGEDEWMGPMLGAVPAQMAASFDSSNLYTTIFIDFAAIEQVIEVKFETAATPGNFQIPNSGFEDWYSITWKKTLSSVTGSEPTHWHSFLSHDGSSTTFKNSAAGAKTSAVTDARPGSKGTKSAKIIPTTVLGVLANGTITTGRLYAGSMTATDSTGNYSFLDMSVTTKDGHGDPFYVELNAKPDSIAFWYKFTAKDATYKYATATAYLTDGKKVTDPNPGAFATHVVARAGNNKIPAASGWTRISIPFIYAPTLYNSKKAVTATGTDVKAIFVTISTNATPGKGNSSDVLYVDDVELIYNPRVSKSTSASATGNATIHVAGKSIEVVDGQDEYTIAFTGGGNAAQRVIRKAEDKTVVTPSDIDVVDADGDALLSTASVVDTEDGAKATVLIYSDDLKSAKTITVNMTGKVTGIDEVVTEATAVGTTYYNLLGVSSKEPFEGINIVVTTYDDGTTTTHKVIK